MKFALLLIPFACAGTALAFPALNGRCTAENLDGCLRGLPELNRAVARYTGPPDTDNCDSALRSFVTQIATKQADLPSVCPQDGAADAPKANPKTPAEFIQYIAPMAIRIQRATGLPASYLIAQAGEESGWGHSNGFRVRNSLFGYSCFGGDKTIVVTIAGGEQVPILARCRYPRPEGGKYYSFATIMQGFWAQAHLILQNKDPDIAKAFDQLRTFVAGRKDKSKPADALGVIQCIRGYSAIETSESYQKKLRTNIHEQGLAFYDSCP